MSAHKHPGKALEIARKERDWRKWGPLIEALTPEEQAEVRPYLRMQATIAKSRAQEQASKTSPIRTLGEFSKTAKRR